MNYIWDRNNRNVVEDFQVPSLRGRALALPQSIMRTLGREIRNSS